MVSNHSSGFHQLVDSSSNDPKEGAYITRLQPATLLEIHAMMMMVMMMVVVVVQVSDVYRKIRLTIRFLLGNVHDFDPSQHAVPYSQLPLTDRYLLARFAHLLQDAQTSYSQFQFAKVYQVVSKVYQVVCASLPGSLHSTLAWLFSLGLHTGRFCYNLVMIGLLYKLTRDGCQHRLQILLRLRPYPMRGHRLLHTAICCQRDALLSQHHFPKVYQAMRSSLPDVCRACNASW